MKGIIKTLWTPERDEELRRLVATGLSYGLIGRTMGITKNAVIGRAHRLFLDPRAEVEEPPRERAPGQEFPPPRHCLYSSDTKIPYRFCGAPSGDSPWCEEHRRRVFILPKKAAAP